MDFQIPVLDTLDLTKSEVLLRRAHHVLSWTMHFYIHSMPPSNVDIIIPRTLSIPLLKICAQLRLPPVLTYSDDVLYNWTFRDPDTRSGASEIALDNLRSQTLFTGTRDEEEFYLTSARIELRGIEALTIISTVMDEIFVGDEIAVRRVTGQLEKLARVISDLRKILLDVKEKCDPMVFYRDIRPWFRGVDSLKTNQRWIFEGLEDQPDLQEPTELSGPSAGQSSLVHALDIFLGVDRYSHDSSMTGRTSPPDNDTTQESTASPPSFLTRMQAYMPRHHRAFLTHLSTNPRPLRDYVITANDAALSDAYNKAVTSLKEFRDGHFQIVALYIIGPAYRIKPMEAESRQSQSSQELTTPQPRQPLKGTGGTDLSKFLKGVRDQTAGALLTQS
jgi:indoleamine 2,3-dioxygenase